MARYIDADKLRDRVKTETNPYGKPTLEYASGVKVMIMIDKAPTADVVEVVRCSECEYKQTATFNGEILIGCNNSSGLNDVYADGFCSYGKQKTQKGEV